MKYSSYIKPRKRSTIEVIPSKSLYIKKFRLGLSSLVPVAFIILIISILYLIIFRTSIFNLEADKIEINGVGNFVDEREFKNKVQEYSVGKNITKLNTSELENKLESDFPSIKSVMVKKSLPPHLVVNVEERKPYFAVYKDNRNDAFMIANDGFVLAKINDRYKEMFKVQYSEDVKVGDTINVEILNLYQDILKKIDEVDLTLDHIVFDKEFTFIYLTNNVVVTLSNKKGVQDSFKIVHSIFDKLNSEDKKVTKIDLRYEKVIVSYN